MQNWPQWAITGKLIDCQNTMAWCFILSVVGVLVVYKLLDYLYRLPRVGALYDKYILVTGCDTGFGNLISKRLDSLGCHVFSGCLTEKGEAELKDATSSRVVTFRLDVTDHKSVTDAYDFIREKLPAGKGLWGILNNAGLGTLDGPVEWVGIEQFHKINSVNLIGLIDVTVTFLPLVKRERGRVVNMSSIMGRLTFIYAPTYSVSKYGVEAFTDALRRNMRMFGVKVSLVEPGHFRTNLTDKDRLKPSLWQSYQRAPAELQDEYGEEFVNGVMAAYSNFDKRASDKLDLVVDAYEHGLLARHPRARYVVGFDAKTFSLPIQWLPEWLGDYILMKDLPLPATRKHN